MAKKLGLKKALELRKAIKKKKPTFLRQDAHKLKKLPKNWRSPKGAHSKMRHANKGKRQLVKKGYGSPKEAYGLHPTGLRVVLVSSLQQLATLDPKTDGVLLSHTVGKKKRMQLIQEIIKRNLTLLNAQDPHKTLEAIGSWFAKKKEQKHKTAVTKQEKAKQAAKEAASKEQKDKDEKQRVGTSNESTASSSSQVSVEGSSTAVASSALASAPSQQSDATPPTRGSQEPVLSSPQPSSLNEPTSPKEPKKQEQRQKEKGAAKKS
ncbi:MAG: 50S ribosomal protein L32e [Candidatus Woesearchaeota archaeon]